ncbi:hypothetical protein BGZ90_011425, partial [Linnemannia elongata]
MLSLEGNSESDEELGSGSGSGGQRGERPGYLNWFGVLTKLKGLGGSFSANTDGTRVTMGWAEARWMASHWQYVEAAVFFEQDEELTGP